METKRFVILLMVTAAVGVITASYMTVTTTQAEIGTIKITAIRQQPIPIESGLKEVTSQVLAVNSKLSVLLAGADENYKELEGYCETDPYCLGGRSIPAGMSSYAIRVSPVEAKILLEAFPGHTVQKFTNADGTSITHHGIDVRLGEKYYYLTVVLP